MGRVGVYLHQGGVKGGALVLVGCQTDFAARTEEFESFANHVAQLAYGSQAETLEDIVECFPEFQETLNSFTKEIGEKISLDEIKLLVV